MQDLLGDGSSGLLAQLLSQRLGQGSVGGIEAAPAPLGLQGLQGFGMMPSGPQQTEEQNPMAALLAMLLSGGGPKEPGNPLEVAAEDAGFLWKPESDSDGRLAIHTPAGFTGQIDRVSIMGPDGEVSGRYAGAGNPVGGGPRDLWRFPLPGESYGQNVAVNVFLKGGGTRQFLIPAGGKRWEGIPKGPA